MPIWNGTGLQRDSTQLTTTPPATRRRLPADQTPQHSSVHSRWRWTTVQPHAHDPDTAKAQRPSRGRVLHQCSRAKYGRLPRETRPTRAHHAATHTNIDHCRCPHNGPATARSGRRARRPGTRGYSPRRAQRGSAAALRYTTPPQRTPQRHAPQLRRILAIQTNGLAILLPKAGRVPLPGTNRGPRGGEPMFPTTPTQGRPDPSTRSDTTTACHETSMRNRTRCTRTANTCQHVAPRKEGNTQTARGCSSVNCIPSWAGEVGRRHFAQPTQLRSPNDGVGLSSEPVSVSHVCCRVSKSSAP